MDRQTPLRVLHVVTNMDRGGLETLIMNYYRRMNRDRIQFDFLVHRDIPADYDAEILSLGGRIYRLPRLNPFSPGYLRQLDRFFSEHREYRIVHCHLDCMAGIPLKAAKKHGVPVRIAHSHNSNQTKDWKYPIKLVCKRRIAAHATALFACSEAAGRWMFGGRDFLVMNNAIDAAAYTYQPQIREEVRRELGLDAEALVVGHVGQFRPQKNHRFLLDVFAKLPPSARLLLVGDGMLRSELERQAKALGVFDRVIFAGVRADVNRLLQAMDVFVFPSLFEGLSVATVEAQTAGLPCLISDKVSLECKKTDLIDQLSLDEGIEAWARRVLKLSSRPRYNTHDQICTAGFDIHTNAAWLQEYYETK